MKDRKVQNINSSNEKIILEYLLHHKFEKTGLEPERQIFYKTSARFTPDALKSLPQKEEDKLLELNVKISDLAHDKFDNLSQMQVKTNINPESFRKAVRLSTKRRITREMLAKFVIGAKLTLSEADELFSLQSYPMDKENVLLDAVVCHCLEEHLDINEFFDTCIQVDLPITPSE